MRLVMFLAGCALSVAVAAEDKFSVNTGVEYTSGDYGLEISTDVWVIPIGIKYQTDKLTLRASTSWLHVSGPGGVTPEGDPLSGTGPRTTEQGMGDITTSLTWNLLDEQAYPVGMDVGGKIKFGTADEKKSLGTGKNDYSLQAEIFKPIDAWYPFLKIGYAWKGDPTGIDYRNVWFGSVGTDYRLAKTYSVGAYYDWRQKLTSYGNTRLDKTNKLNFYAITGFSDASPNWGAGLSLTHVF
jgi:hypothetical protein